MGEEHPLKGFELIYYDDLTGLFNKRFLNGLKNFIYGKILLTIFDIDDFKSINDIYGHQTGDHIIKKVSEILIKYSKKGEFPIRYGGDEFVLISSYTNLENFVKKLEDMKNFIQMTPFVYNNNIIRLTLSFGVSDGDIENIQSILENADSALYISKGKGKNCITVYKGDEEETIKLPFRFEREVKNCLVSGKNVLIRGGIKSGKTYFKNILQKNFNNINFIEYKKDISSVPSKNVCFFYDPFLYENDQNLKNILTELKSRDYKEFSMDNLSFQEFVRVFDLSFKEESIFLLNFAYDLTCGNRFLTLKFLKEKSRVWELDIFDFFDDLLHYDLNFENCIKKIIDYGFLIEPEKVKSKNDLETIERLLNRQVLFKEKDFFRYSYPSLYFYYAKKFKRELKLPENFKIFQNIRLGFISNDIKKYLKNASDLYYYGDLDLSEKLLSKVETFDDRKNALMGKIYLAKREFTNAERYCEKIKSKNERDDLKFLVQYFKNQNIFEKKCKTITQKLCYLGYLYHNMNFKRFIEYSKSFDYNKLNRREKITYDFLLGNFKILQEKYTESEIYLNRCKKLCLKHNFYGDLGKVYMSYGIMYDEIEEFEKSLENYNRALDIFRYSNSKNALKSLLMNLAVLYSKFGDFSTSFDIFSTLLHEEKNDNIFFKRNIFNNLSAIYFNTFDFEKSRYYLDQLKNMYDKKDIIPDYIILHESKLRIVEGKIDFVKLDNLNKNDIINRLEIECISFILKEFRDVNLKKIERFVNSFMKICPGKNILVKNELLIFICYIFKNDDLIKNYLCEKIIDNFKFLKLNTRIEFFREKMGV